MGPHCFAPVGVRTNLKQTASQAHQIYACDDTGLAGADRLPTSNLPYAREVCSCQISQAEVYFIPQDHI